MSSDLLLKGRGISKIYSSPLSPLSRLKSALLKREPEGDVHHVLNNIDIDIYRGETVGIMGRNGAGKSTLLGILGNVTPATSGHIERVGSMAVLLELGAGFNNNISGIENVRIYCRMMGIAENEIDEKIDQIEEFAELDKYFRLPVRTYSSGMYSRLGFSAAVHVDADMVIVDETLSVGDASFKMKCYEKIDQMKKSGMTFLLVSHSQNLVANFCTRAIVIEGGKKKFDGSPLDAVGVFKEIRAAADLKRKPKVVVKKENPNQPDDKSIVKKLAVKEFSYREGNRNDTKLGIIDFVLTAKTAIQYPGFSIGVRNSSGVAICSISSDELSVGLSALEEGEHINISVDFHHFLNPGPYFISYKTFELIGDVQNIMSIKSNVLRFDVIGQKQGHGVVNLNMTIDWSNDLTRMIKEKN